MTTPPVMVGIASIPEREAALERTIASLAPQADRICLSLNDYKHEPAFLSQYPNVEATVRTPTNGGDAEKFAAVDDWEGVVATCDDDLVYPPDYIATLVAGLERYGPDAIVGFHGGKTRGWNGSALAASHRQIRCLGELACDDLDVNVLGTGALAFHAGHVPVWRDVFLNANMADVHLACHAHQLGIRMVALAHPAGWLTDICPPTGRRIYESNRDRDGSPCDTSALRQQELGRFDWQQLTGRPLVHVAIATCERPALLGELLVDLERESRFLDLEVSVYDDASEADDGLAREFCDRNGWEWHRFPERLGKPGHFQLVNQELADARDSAAGWFVFLPDDVRLVRHALPRAIDTWQRLEDPATLTLWRLKDHEGQPNWTGLLPVEHDHGWEVFHVDGIHLCRRETLATLEYRCPGIRRRTIPLGSSGVGRGMSLHLHRAGKRMYRVSRSLAVPVPDAPSVMNPNVRDRRYEGIAL